MPQIGYEVMGRFSLYFVNIMQVIGFGLLPISYFIIFANLLRSFLNEINWVDNNARSSIGSQWLSGLILAVIIFPLIIKKKIQELKIASILLFTSVLLFIVLMLCLRIFNYNDVGLGPIGESHFYHFSFDKAFISSLSTAFVAYGFQSAFFPIYNSLEKRTYTNGMTFTFMGVGFCFIIYMCVMFISLYTFGIHVQGDVLENVEEVTDWESYILRALFLLVMASHVPFIFFVGKESVLALVALCYLHGAQKEDIDNNVISEEGEISEGHESHGLLDENTDRDSTGRRTYNRSHRHLTTSEKLFSVSTEKIISMAIPFSKKKDKILTIEGN